MVHGDINPGNVFITNEGELRVLDFGAAHAPHEGPTVGASADPVPVATPRYASPQVLDGQRPDARDDVYSLACLSYVLLGGKHPFGDKTALGAQEQRLRPSRPAGLSGKEWRALRAGLAFDRERRPSDVAQWLNAFDWSQAAARLPLLITLVRVPARKPRSWAAALAAAAVVAALAAAVWASVYFDIGKRAPSSVTSESEPQSGAPPTPSDDSGTAVQATRSSPAAQPADVPLAQPAARAANPSPSSAPAPAPTSSPTSPPPSSSTEGRAPPAEGAHGAPVETSALPRSRIELVADTIDVPLTDPAARIIIRRRGSLQGNATFTWWTKSAPPSRDRIS